MPDPNPELIYRPRPNSVETNDEAAYGEISVHINGLGFRGKDRSVSKPEGVFRILCLGGSNVFGYELNDDQTWPHLLEQQLNRRNPGRFEVWNLGVGGYNGQQMAVTGKEACEKYDPDLLILALSNAGATLFPLNDTVTEIFRKAPQYWDFLIPQQDLYWSKWIPASIHKSWVRHFRLYRYTQRYHRH